MVKKQVTIGFYDIFEEIDNGKIDNDKRDWYRALINIKDHLINNNNIAVENQITNDELKEYTVHHMLDTLNFKGMIDILNGKEKRTIGDCQFRDLVNDYFEKRTLDNHIYLMKSEQINGSDIINKPVFYKKIGDNYEETTDITDRNNLISELTNKIISIYKINTNINISNKFGLISSKFKRSEEIREFKVRDKIVSKNKIGSIIRGTFDENKNLLISLSENAFGKNIYKTIDYIIKDETSDNKDKKAYITGALPTLVEILLRHINKKNTEVMYFLTMEEFDLYRKYIEKTAKPNWKN